MDLDNISDFTYEHENLIKLLKESERNARIKARGPVWGAYQSEFGKE